MKKILARIIVEVKGLVKSVMNEVEKFEALSRGKQVRLLHEWGKGVWVPYDNNVMVSEHVDILNNKANPVGYLIDAKIKMNTAGSYDVTFSGFLTFDRVGYENLDGEITKADTVLDRLFFDKDNDKKFGIRFGKNGGPKGYESVIWWFDHIDTLEETTKLSISELAIMVTASCNGCRRKIIIGADNYKEMSVEERKAWTEKAFGITL